VKFNLESAAASLAFFLLPGASFLTGVDAGLETFEVGFAGVVTGAFAVTGFAAVLETGFRTVLEAGLAVWVDVFFEAVFDLVAGCETFLGSAFLAAAEVFFTEAAVLFNVAGAFLREAEAFFAGAATGLDLAAGFCGAGFLTSAFFGAGLAWGIAFLAAAFGRGLDGAEDFLAVGLAGFELDFAAGLEVFVVDFFVAVVLAAGRDGLFEEVVFVFNLLSVRLGEKAVEHPPLES